MAKAAISVNSQSVASGAATQEYRLAAGVAPQDVDLEVIKASLADHPGMVCAHGETHSKRRFGTLWSLAGIPGERRVEIAAGNPCMVPYEQYEF